MSKFILNTSVILLLLPNKQITHVAKHIVFKKRNDLPGK